MSAETPRFPRTISFSRVVDIRRWRAASTWVIPRGRRKSLRSTSPGWSGRFSARTIDASPGFGADLMLSSRGGLRILRRVSTLLGDLIVRRHPSWHVDQSDRIQSHQPLTVELSAGASIHELRESVKTAGRNPRSTSASARPPSLAGINRAEPSRRCPVCGLHAFDQRTATAS